ncbi:MAG: ATP-dependent helicase/nuclease subunit B, partial [Bacteroidia bacterium]
MAHGLYNIAALEPLIDKGFIILTPNLRLSRRIKSQWDRAQLAAGLTVWEAVAALPLEEWLMRQWQEAVRCEMLPALVPLSMTQELAIWQQVIAHHSYQAGGFSLIRDASAAELASQARDTLLRWELDMVTPVIRQQFQLEPDCDTFLAWLGLFEARLAAAGLCTRAQCLVALSKVGATLGQTQVVLVECEDLPPVIQRCLSVLTSAVERQTVGETRLQAQVHAFPDRRAELQGVASWAAQLHRDKPD